MPPVVKLILQAVVKVAVVWLAGFLAAHANLTLSEAQIGALVTYLTPVALVLVWSIMQHFRNRKLLLTALMTPWAMTEREVRDRLKDPRVPTPSINTDKDEVPR